MRCQTLFSNSSDEEGFYLCCANVELHGVKALGIILDYINTPLSSHTDADLSHISCALEALTGIIDELNDILKSVRSTCDPHAFYFSIRPWFRGSDADGAESPGWIYAGIDPARHLELSGPSAGQSTVM
jgi:indoleamine 2,3-dioxygenase